MFITNYVECCDPGSGCPPPNPNPTPTSPPPPPPGCNFGACGVNCPPNQQYISGNCWSYSWFSGDNCYLTSNCSSPPPGASPTPTPTPYVRIRIRNPSLTPVPASQICKVNCNSSPCIIDTTVPVSCYSN